MIIGDFLSNNEILETLARRMKEYRLAARLSQRELAQNRVWATRLYAISSKEESQPLAWQFHIASACVGMERRMMDVLPELPVPPMALKEINKLIPKRVRRKEK